MVETQLCKLRGTWLYKKHKKTRKIILKSAQVHSPLRHLAIYAAMACKETYRPQYGEHESCEKSTHGIDQHNKHSTLKELTQKRERAALAATTHSSGGGERRGGRFPSKELRHSSSSVFGNGHPAGGAHTALALARRGHDHRKPIFDFWKQTQ